MTTVGVSGGSKPCRSLVTAAVACTLLSGAFDARGAADHAGPRAAAILDPDGAAATLQLVSERRPRSETAAGRPATAGRWAAS